MLSVSASSKDFVTTFYDLLIGKLMKCEVDK